MQPVGVYPDTRKSRVEGYTRLFAGFPASVRAASG